MKKLISLLYSFRCAIGLHIWFDAKRWLAPCDQYCSHCLRKRMP